MLESPGDIKAFESKAGQAWAREIVVDYYSRSGGDGGGDGDGDGDGDDVDVTDGDG